MKIRILAVCGVVLGGAGCSDNQSAIASVHGEVFQSGETPLANSQVVISCPDGGVQTTVPTDAGGLYTVNLVAAHTGTMRLDCRFEAPSVASPVAGADTTIGFAADNDPHPLQTVNLLPIN